MTPTEELRAAAALLRKRGAEATPGPWERPLNTRYKHIVTAAKPDDEQGRYLDGRPERVGVVQLNIWSNGAHMRSRGGRDLEWIALASPALAEPMADLLEYAARSRKAAETAAESVSDETATVRADDIDHLTPWVLALARQINGTSS